MKQVKKPCMALINENPTVFDTLKEQVEIDWDDDHQELLSKDEIFQLIRHINDPEHPLTLEQLNVAQKDLISIKDNIIQVQFTPTIPHCSMATLIGLCIRVQLLRCVPNFYKIHIQVTPGTHQSENAVNKQLNDKERVAAAMENSHLLQVVHQSIATAIDKLSW